jgi:signal transduction histidine kinase
VDDTPRVGADSRFLELVVGSLSSGLLAVDREGRVGCANAPARRILRLDADGQSPPIGAPCREALAAQPELAELVLSALGGAEPPGRAELELRAASGSPGPTIGFTLTTIRDPAGSVQGAALVFRDLTPLEQLEGGERLRERLAALGEMAAGLAHELRNPLASLKVGAALLERRVGGDAEAVELFQEMHSEIVALERTVDGALDFVKPLPMATTEVDLVEALEDVYTRVARRIPFSGRVECRYDRPAPVVMGDPQQLRSVFANLLANAFEAMAECPRGVLLLEVGSGPADAIGRLLRMRSGTPREPGRAGREAWVSITDSGPGVPPEHRQRIFYPFFTTRESGSGVGLAVAQKIVAAHGGALELLEAPRGGATFRVRLPAPDGEGAGERRSLGGDR